MIDKQKINGVGRIKFRISMHNSTSAFSLIMGDPNFSEFATVGMWARRFYSRYILFAIIWQLC